MQVATINVEKFMGIVRRHLAFEELARTILGERTEKIVVHKCSYNEKGIYRQNIKVPPVWHINKEPTQPQKSRRYYSAG